MLPVAAGINATKASRGRDDALAILLKHFKVNARIAIKVFRLIGLGNQLEEVVQALLVLGKQNKVPTTV